MHGGAPRVNTFKLPIIPTTSQRALYTPLSLNFIVVSKVYVPHYTGY